MPANQITPGPWHVGMSPGPMVYGPRGEWIARCDMETTPREEAAANACAIAAVPDLVKIAQWALPALKRLELETRLAKDRDVFTGRAAFVFATLRALGLA